MAHASDPEEAEWFARSTVLSQGDEPALDPEPASSVVGAGSPSAAMGTSTPDPGPGGATADGTSPGAAAERTPFEVREFRERYLPREILGRGGMGEVRLCKDLALGRNVALKVVRPRGGEPTLASRRRFVREARVQGQLEHPAVVPVYDAGVDPDGALYFTMKRVRGASLVDVLRDLRGGAPGAAQRYSQRRLLTLFSQVCMCVHFGHRKGVVHRDLKPDNLMIGDFGEVYVLDWGLSTLREEVDADADPVDDGGVGAMLGSVALGTPGYMAPEQIEPTALADARCDVYALGAILFEILTLERLHRGAMDEVLLSTLTMDGARPSERAPDRSIPPELDRLCHAATRLDPAQRLASTEALSQAVEAYLDGDRDLALRRDLAEVHAKAARDALARAHDGAEELSARAQAAREVTAALALHPGHRGARETLIRLIAEPPRALPEEARAQIDETRRATYRLGLRVAVGIYLSYLAYMPLLLWMGVRDWGLFALGWGLIGACALATYVLLRRPASHAGVPLVHLGLSTLTVGASSVMFGPFVLVPMLALSSSVAYLSSIDERRGLVTAAGCLAVLVPAVLGWAGVIPIPYVFEAGRWTVLPSAFHISPLPTQVFLLCASLGTIAPACWFVARLRHDYSAAERKLQVQAWQLRRMVPGDDDDLS